MNTKNKTLKLVSLFSILLIAGAISMVSLNANENNSSAADNDQLALSNASISIEASTVTEGKCGDEKKDAKTDKATKKEGAVKAEHKCGDGKCGTDTKEAKTDKTTKTVETKSAEHKCGDGKCGADTKATKEEKATKTDAKDIDVKDKDGKCK